LRSRPVAEGNPRRPEAKKRRIRLDRTFGASASLLWCGGAPPGRSSEANHVVGESAKLGQSRQIRAGVLSSEHSARQRETWKADALPTELLPPDERDRNYNRARCHTGSQPPPCDRRPALEPPGGQPQPGHDPDGHRPAERLERFLQELVAKVTDVVGLYLAPPERAIVLSVDEKTQIQALDRDPADAPAPAGPGGAAHPRRATARSACSSRSRSRPGTYSGQQS
jgi:hypothetical protein